MNTTGVQLFVLYVRRCSHLANFPPTGSSDVDQGLSESFKGQINTLRF